MNPASAEAKPITAFLKTERKAELLKGSGRGDYLGNTTGGRRFTCEAMLKIRGGRMSNMRKLSAPERRRRRLIVLSCQSGSCFWCGDPLAPEASTIDELLPRSRGGTQRWLNIVAACVTCNSQRAATIAPKWAFDRVAEREERRAAVGS